MGAAGIDFDLGRKATSVEGRIGCSFWFSSRVTERLLVLFSTGAVQASQFLPVGWKLGEEDLSGAEVEAICSRLAESLDADAARAAVQIASYRSARKQEEMSQTLMWSLLMNPNVFERHQDNMTSHYWKTLANGFRKRYPERDIELLDGVLTHHCKRGGASFSAVSETIFEISKDHPSKSWPRVARALEESEASWSIAHWLGDAMRGEGQAAIGARERLPIDCYDPQEILAWLAQDPSRADLVIQALPKSLEQGRGGELTRGFIEFFGANSDQARSLMAHFDTGLRWGPDSAFYARQRDRARTWIDGGTTNVREWIGDWLARLSRLIERAGMNEERSF